MDFSKKGEQYMHKRERHHGKSDPPPSPSSVEMSNLTPEVKLPLRQRIEHSDGGESRNRSRTKDVRQNHSRVESIPLDTQSAQLELSYKNRRQMTNPYQAQVTYAAPRPRPELPKSSGPTFADRIDAASGVKLQGQNAAAIPSERPTSSARGNVTAAATQQAPTTTQLANKSGPTVSSGAVWVSPLIDTAHTGQIKSQLWPSDATISHGIQRVEVQPKVGRNDEYRMLVTFKGPQADVAALRAIEKLHGTLFMCRTLSVVGAPNSLLVSNINVGMKFEVVRSLLSEHFRPRVSKDATDARRLGAIGIIDNVHLLTNHFGYFVGTAIIQYSMPESAELLLSEMTKLEEGRQFYQHEIMGTHPTVWVATDEDIEYCTRPRAATSLDPQPPTITTDPRRLSLPSFVTPRPWSVGFDPGCGARGAIRLQPIPSNLTEREAWKLFADFSSPQRIKPAWIHVFEVSKRELTGSTKSHKSTRAMVQYDSPDNARLVIGYLNGRPLHGAPTSASLALACLLVKGVDTSVVPQQMSKSNLKNCLAEYFAGQNNAALSHSNYGKTVEVRLHQDNGRLDGRVLVNFKDPFVAEVELERHLSSPKQVFMGKEFRVRYASVAEVDERLSHKSPIPTEPGQPKIVTSSLTGWV